MGVTHAGPAQGLYGISVAGRFDGPEIDEFLVVTLMNVHMEEGMHEIVKLYSRTYAGNDDGITCAIELIADEVLNRLMLLRAADVNTTIPGVGRKDSYGGFVLSHTIFTGNFSADTNNPIFRIYDAETKEKRLVWK